LLAQQDDPYNRGGFKNRCGRRRFGRRPGTPESKNIDTLQKDAKNKTRLPLQIFFCLWCYAYGIASKQRVRNIFFVKKISSGGSKTNFDAILLFFSPFYGGRYLWTQHSDIHTTENATTVGTLAASMPPVPLGFKNKRNGESRFVEEK
jgi:hypothetical protein